MKAILIAAATLMTGASVYGIVDYNKRSGTKEFENLYRAKHPAAEKTVIVEEAKAVKEEKPVATTLQPVKEEWKTKKPVKKLKKKRTVSYKTFSRAEPVEVIVEKER